MNNNGALFNDKKNRALKPSLQILKKVAGMKIIERVFFSFNFELLIIKKRIKHFF